MAWKNVKEPTCKYAGCATPALKAAGCLLLMLSDVNALTSLTTGNRFIMITSQSSSFTSTQTLASCRFTADQNALVNQFAIVLYQSTNNPAFVVSLRPDDGGNPSTNILATTTLYPGNVSPGTFNLNGQFETSVNLSNGTVYHLVAQVTNAAATNFVSLRALSADFRFTPRTGQPDPMLTRLTSTDGGAIWTVSTQVFGYIYAFALGDATNAFGQIYSSVTSYGVGGVTTRGQRFIYDAGAYYVVTSVTVRVSKGAGNAADDLRLYLLDQNRATIASNTLLTAGFTNTTATNYTLFLTNHVALTNGAIYNLVLESSGSSGNSYLLNVPASILSNQFAATYQGTNGYAVTGNSITNLSTLSTPTTAYDMFFELGTVYSPPPGTIIRIY